MGLIERMLITNAVYWAPTGAADRFGKRVLATPVNVMVRWETGGEDSIDFKGTISLATSKVFVSQSIETEGYLMLGHVADLAGTPQPPPPDSAFEIKRVTELNTINGNRTVRWAFL